jgi:hypothetical protein
MARRAYRQDVGMVLKKTRLGGFFVACKKVPGLLPDHGAAIAGNIGVSEMFTGFRQLLPSRSTGQPRGTRSANRYLL